MTDRTFVDTNVWVYAVDRDAGAKQATAVAVLNPARADDLVISSQVLGEFYVTVTKKLSRPVPRDAAARMVDQMRRLPVVAIDEHHVTAAIAGHWSWGLSYWDALIVAAAERAGCNRLLTEDLADGATYGTVRVENPFAERRRVSEERASFATPGPWDDEGLAVELARYEQASRHAGMRPNAVHSYWDYARRFLDWRTGAYLPRGVSDGARPVAITPVTADDLERQAAEYARAIEAAGREPATVDTYRRHALFFVRWLRGEFRPGARLAGRRRSPQPLMQQP
jgi:predicted nucleic acid-binding protein